jgi:WD40 repeat protein
MVGPNTIRLWETAGWTELKPLEAADRTVFHLAFSADSKRVILGDVGGMVICWTISSREKRVVHAGGLPGEWAVLSPDCQRIAYRSYSQVTVRDVETQKVRFRRELGLKPVRSEMERNTYGHSDVCYSPDGKILAIAGRGTSVRCFDAETGKELGRFGEPEVGFRDIEFSRDSKRLAAVCGSGVRLWDLATGKELISSSELSSPIHALAVSPDGKQLAFGDGHNLRLYESATLKQIWRYLEDGDYAQRIAFGPDGMNLMAGNVARIRFHDVGTGTMTHAWGKGLPAPDPSFEFGLLVPDFTTVVSIRIDIREKTDPDVHIRAAATGKERFTFQGDEGQATAANVSPDGQLLAIGYREAPVGLFRIATGNKVGQLEVTNPEWHRLLFAPDGRTAASGDGKGMVRLLEVSTGKQRLSISAREGNDVEFVFSPQGNVLATWEWRSGGTISLWDALTGRPLGRLEGHRSAVRCAAFTPDGKTLITGSDDTTILFWDITSFLKRDQASTLSPQVLAAAWTDLADLNASKGGRAMAALRDAGNQAVDLLRTRVRPEQAPTAEQIAGSLKDLDHNDFAIREQAGAELEKRLEVVVASLRKALAAGPSPEVRRRLTSLVERADLCARSGEALRLLRAIEVLERIGSPEARRVLETVAGGSAEARLTQEATGALKRLPR